MPDLLIIAGPNGAGKTTFAREYLARESIGFAFVNADEIERVLRTPDPNTSAIAAARAMLAEVEVRVSAGSSLAIETTLAARTYAPKIAAWRSAGYIVRLLYLRLATVEASIARVARRVAAGGHDIPEETIRRRFARSLDYLETRYKSAVDQWRIYDSLEGEFRLAARWDEP